MLVIVMLVTVMVKEVHRERRIHQKTICYTHSSRWINLPLFLILLTYSTIQQASAITRNVTVFRLQTIVENSCRSQGHCPPSEMMMDVGKGMKIAVRLYQPIRNAVTSCLLRVHEFAIVETPRCSR